MFITLEADISPKKKFIGITLSIALVVTSGFLLYQNFFKADVAGAFTISGNIYGEDSKSPLADAYIMITSSDSNKSGITTKTNSSGHYAASLPDNTYTNISITKENYWDMDGVITNSGKLEKTTLNFVMKPGFGKEDIQIVTAKKNSTFTNPTPFGLSLEPFDSSPASLTQVVPDGNSYKLEPTPGTLTDSKDAPYSPLNFNTTNAGQLPSELSYSSAVYSPDTDKYYIIGSTDPASSTLPPKIYEYDRTTQKAEAKLDLPGAANSISSLYIPEKKLVMIVLTPVAGKGKIFLYDPAQNFLFLVDQSPENVSKLIRLNDSILLVAENHEDNQTSFVSKFKIDDIHTSSSCQIGTGNRNCPVATSTTNITPVDLVGTTPYYSSCHNKIFLFGGSDSTGAKDTILELDASKALTTTETASSFAPYTKQKLTAPILSAKLVKFGDRIILFGGFDASNTAIQNRYLAIDEACNGTFGQENNLSNTTAIDFNLPYPIGNYGLAQDNSGGAFIFGGNASTGDNAKYIQKIAPAVSLSLGQKYALDVSQDTTIIFKGRAKTDEYSISPQQGEELKLANPYLTDITLGDITITYQDKTYNLTEATKRTKAVDAIVSVTSNLYDNQPNIDTNNLSQVIKPGQIIPISIGKSGVKVGIKVETSYLKNSEIKLIEVPKNVSSDDVKKISENSLYSLSVEEKTRLLNIRKQLIDLIISQSENEQAEFLNLPDVYFTKNDKILDFSQFNSFWLNQLNQQSSLVNRTYAEEDDSKSLTFTVDIDSFKDDKESYDRIKTFIDLNVSRIKEILGESFFNRTINIINAPGLKNAEWDPSLNAILIDMSMDSIRNACEATLLHEISHSWRDRLAYLYSEEMEEGLAQGFVYVYKDSYKADYPDFEHMPIDFEKMSEIMSFYNPYLSNDTQNRRFSKIYYLYLFNSADPDEDAFMKFFPRDHAFWTRQISGEFILKLFNENNIAFKNIQRTYWNYLMNSNFPDGGKLYKYLCPEEKCSNELLTNRLNDNLTPSTFEKFYNQFEIDNKFFYENILDDELDGTPKLENKMTSDWAKANPALYDDPKAAPGETSKGFLVLGSNETPICDMTLFKTNIGYKYGCMYNNYISFSEVAPSQAFSSAYSGYMIDPVANSPVRLNLYNGTTPSVIKERKTDSNGVLEISGELNSSSGYSGSQHIVAVDTANTKKGVFSENIFTKNNSHVGKGFFGTIDQPDGTQVKLDRIRDNLRGNIATTFVTNGIYEFPDSADINGRFVITVPSANYEKYENKGLGSYQLDIKTDTTAPSIIPKGLSGNNIEWNNNSVIEYNLNEPASVFVEYGGEKDKYNAMTFGKIISGYDVREGDEIKDGDRSITVGTSPWDSHYRIWAIDRSGNISHTDDLVGHSITNIESRTLSSTSVKICWKTSANSTGQVEYGTTTSYGTTTGFKTASGEFHSQEITGLTPGTKYNFRIKVDFDDDTEEEPEYSNNHVFQPLKINNISNVDHLYGKLTYSTSEPAYSVFEYGTTPSYGSAINFKNDKDSYRDIQLPLENVPDGFIYYRIKAWSQDESNAVYLTGSEEFHPCGHTWGYALKPYPASSATISNYHNFKNFSVEYNGQTYSKMETCGDYPCINIPGTFEPINIYNYRLKYNGSYCGTSRSFALGTSIKKVDTCSTANSIKITPTFDYGSLSEEYYEYYYREASSWQNNYTNPGPWIKTASLTSGLLPNRTYDFLIKPTLGKIPLFSERIFGATTKNSIVVSKISDNEFETNVSVNMTLEEVTDEVNYYTREIKIITHLFLSGSHFNIDPNLYEIDHLHSLEVILQKQGDSIDSDGFSAERYCIDTSGGCTQDMSQRYRWLFPTYSDSNCAAGTLSQPRNLAPQNTNSSLPIANESYNSGDTSLNFSANPSIRETDSGIESAENVTVEWGTSPNELTNFAPAKNVGATNYSYKFDFKKPRTYSYRVIYKDKDNNVYHTDTRQIKYGNKYLRFINDTVGNSWSWVKKQSKKLKLRR